MPLFVFYVSVPFKYRKEYGRNSVLVFLRGVIYNMIREIDFHAFWEGNIVNMKKPDLKKTFVNFKKSASRKTAARKKKKNAPFHGYAAGERNDMPRRSGKLVLPVGAQTVIAVLVCCGVLLLVGAGVFTSQQMEISDLKAEIKTYVDDGVVPAGSMTESLSLNIEAIGGRIDMVQRVLDNAADGKLSGEDIQWVGVQLNEIQIEVERLNIVLNDADADKALRKLFNETVQSPLVTLTETYDTMTVNDADIVDTTVENGASNDTGAFKVTGELEKSIRWIVIAVVLVVLIVAAVLFRHKLAGLFRRGGKKQAKGRKTRAASAENSKEKAAPKQKPAEKQKPKAEVKAEGKDTHSHPFAEEAAETEETNAVDSASINDDESFFAAMAQLAENERKKAEEAEGMPEPSPEERITFDASVATQEDIDEDDDPLFRKNE